MRPRTGVMFSTGNPQTGTAGYAAIETAKGIVGMGVGWADVRERVSRWRGLASGRTSMARF